MFYFAKSMTRFIHRTSIVFYSLIVLITFTVLFGYGYSYYQLPLEHRYDNQVLYNLLNPNGSIGHWLGIIGTVLILIGQFIYMARKRIKLFMEIGILKYWLEFHIFLCTWGTVMVLFHTTFKFGGIVSIGWWSLVIVWISGVIGRFIYLQIPRSMEGRELSLKEVQEQKESIEKELKTKYGVSFLEFNSHKVSENKLLADRLSRNEYHKARQLIKTESRIVKRMERLDYWHNLLKYWHYAHLPFALIMIIIMLIHVIVVLYFAQILSLWTK